MSTRSLAARPAQALTRVVVSAAYGAQGFGYAAAMTTLPTFKTRFGMSATVVSASVLLVCATAALGSLAAGAIGKRFGSRVSLSLGLAVQAVSLLAVATSNGMGMFLALMAIYGVGLGAVDAATAMQGVLVERLRGRRVLSGFFAVYTAGAIVAALVVSGAVAQQVAVAGVVGAGLLTAVVAVAGWWFFAVDEATPQPVATAETAGAEEKSLSARRGIWLFGTAILVIFTADSAVSTWSTEYLQTTLKALPAAAPLGYAAYQAVVLVTRLTGDRLSARLGRRTLVTVASIIGIAGFLLVALVHTLPAAIIGFAVVGVGVGVVVPMTFSAAGEVDPGQSDRIVSDMNTFNYIGAVIGGGIIGPLADTGMGMAWAFLVPAVLLAAMPVLARHYGTHRAVTAAQQEKVPTPVG